MQQFKISHSITITEEVVTIDGTTLYSAANSEADFLSTIYKNKGISYAKFFKMDRISKLGFLATELLMEVVDKDFDKTKTAVIITTTEGSQEIDERFESTRKEIPSPALFVYTLPNIAVGEICIRNGFKGEQMVWISAEENEPINKAYIAALFENGNTQTCLTGYLNAYDGKLSCRLHWLIAS